MSTLMLAMLLSVTHGHVMDRQPGKVLVCGEMQALRTGGAASTCEWVKVTGKGGARG